MEKKAYREHKQKQSISNGLQLYTYLKLLWAFQRVYIKIRFKTKVKLVYLDELHM